MTTAPSTTPRASATARRDLVWLRLVQLGTPVVIVGIVILGVVMLLFTTVDEGEFRYAADYWLTGAGLPIALGGVTISWGVHRLHHGSDGRLGLVGTWLVTVGLTELFIQLGASVVAGEELRWGPMYIVAAFVTYLGLALQAAGSWRAGLLPPWMLGIWPLVWVLGSFTSLGPTPLLLALFLVLFTTTLTRRVRARA